MARKTMTPAQVYELRTLAGNFPPTLNTSTPPTDLEIGETPECYGIDMTVKGRLKTGTIPTGTSRVAKTQTITTVPYIWVYKRLFNITNLTASTASTILRYGAPHYDDVYMKQGVGGIQFDEDAQTLVQIVPFGQDSLLIGKSTGSYVLSNLNDTRGDKFWGKTDIIQKMAVSAAARVTELDGVVYTSNADGLFVLKEGRVEEITERVKDDVTDYANQTLTIDYDESYIIGGTKFAYDVVNDKLFNWATSGFRFTSRQFHLPDWAPVSIDELLFVIEHSDTEDGELKYQKKYDEEDWTDEYTVELPYNQEKYTMVSTSMDREVSVRKVQVRLTSLTATKYIKEIRLGESSFNVDDYVL